MVKSNLIIAFYGKVCHIAWLRLTYLIIFKVCMFLNSPNELSLGFQVSYPEALFIQGRLICYIHSYEAWYFFEKMIIEDHNYFLVLGIPHLIMIYTCFLSILRVFVCLLDKLCHSKGMELWIIISNNWTALKIGLDHSVLCQT